MCRVSLTGFLKPTEGDVFLDETKITQLDQHKRVAKGLVRTFQINRLFNELTPFQSVLMAVNERLGIGSSPWKQLSSHTESVDEAMRVLTMLKMTDVAYIPTRDLPYGKQRLLEIALALAADPNMLLLDEPAAGVPTAESQELFDTISGLPKEVTVLLIEHDMNLVFGFADWITVLVNGAILTEGTPDEISKNQKVKQVYLGEAINV